MIITKSIDYRGCSLEIAAELQRGNAVYCRSESGSGWVTHYEAFDKSYRFKLDGRQSLTWVSHPEPCKRKARLLPPLRAFQVLLEKGWSFDVDGNLCRGMEHSDSPTDIIEAENYHLFGTVTEVPEEWPTCVLEDE